MSQSEVLNPMIAKKAPGRPTTATVSQSTESINRAILGTLVDAWSQYPSAVLLPTYQESKLFKKVLGLLAQEGIVQMTGNSLALTTRGYDAVQHAAHTDDRLFEVLQDGRPPTERPGSSSLLLAILRANFRKQSEFH